MDSPSFEGFHTQIVNLLIAVTTIKGGSHTYSLYNFVFKKQSRTKQNKAEMMKLENISKLA